MTEETEIVVTIEVTREESLHVEVYRELDGVTGSVEVSVQHLVQVVHEGRFEGHKGFLFAEQIFVVLMRPANDEVEMLSHSIVDHLPLVPPDFFARF